MVLQGIWREHGSADPSLLDSLLFRHSRVRLFVTPWTAARQASLSLTVSQSSPKPMSIEPVIPSSHLILCCALFFLPSIFPNIRVFSNQSTIRLQCPEYWRFSFFLFVTVSCTILQTSVHISSGILSTRSNTLNLLSPPLYIHKRFYLGHT